MRSSVAIRWFALTATILVMLISLTCIERNNPWDPINGCPETWRSEIRENSRGTLNKTASNASLTYLKIIQFSDSLKTVKISNDSLRKIFDRQKAAADSIKQFNSTIDETNRTSDCKELKLKKVIESFPEFQLLTAPVQIDQLRNSLSSDSSKAILQISNDNSQCFPQGVYSETVIDSIMKHYISIITSTDQLITELKNYNTAISDSNKLLIEKLNDECRLINSGVEFYNDSINKEILYCDRNWLNTRDSIFKKIPTLKPGDTLLLDSGVIKSDIRFSEKGDTTHPIIIEGSPFMNTRLDTSNVNIHLCKNLLFKNIIFTNGLESNVNVSQSRDIHFENCTFSNSLNGIYITRSEIYLNGCQVIKNKASGVYCTDSSWLSLKNVLIARNAEHGMQILASEATIKKSTISDNSKSGIYIINQKRPINVINSLITFNKESGLVRERSEDKNNIEFFNCSFYGNQDGNFQGDLNRILIDSSCINANPFYINSDQIDYRIGKESELYNKGWGYQPQ